MQEFKSFFESTVPLSWTGVGIDDCPLFVTIDMMNGAVQSKIPNYILNKNSVKDRESK